MSEIGEPGVASPCTGVCRLDPRSGWCVSCLRSRSEIAGWGSGDDRDRRNILASLEGRRQALEAAKR